MIEDHTQVHPAYDRSFTARFERALVKFLNDFMVSETGHEPGFHIFRRDSVLVEARMVLPDSPGISITATVVE